MFFLAMAVVLVVGDLGSTFFYHVPQHLWGRIHLKYHHDNRRSYWDHAVLSRNPLVLLDGFLGALPYMVVCALMFKVSPAGALAGLVLGQLHVWWRHTTELGWKTPEPIVKIARVLQIVLPEDHAGHHRDPEIEFGDLFRFYDAPARWVIERVRAETRHRRAVMKRLQRMRSYRTVRASRSLRGTQSA
jgi:hypothetical protein